MADDEAVEEPDYLSKDSPDYNTEEGIRYRLELKRKFRDGPLKMPTLAEGTEQALREAPWYTRAASEMGVGMGDALARSSFGLVPRDILFSGSPEERRQQYEGAERVTSTDEDGSPNYLGQAMRFASGAPTDLAGLIATRGVLGTAGKALSKLPAVGKAFTPLAAAASKVGETAVQTGYGVGAAAAAQAAIAPEVQRELYDDPYADTRGVIPRALESGLSAGIGAGLGAAIAPAGASFGRQVAGGAAVDAGMSLSQRLARGEDLKQAVLGAGVDTLAGAVTNVPMAAATGRARTFSADAAEEPRRTLALPAPKDSTVVDAEVVEPTGPRMLNAPPDVINLPDRQKPKALPAPNDMTPTADVQQHAMDLEVAARERRRQNLINGIEPREAESRAEREKQDAIHRDALRREQAMRSRAEAEQMKAAQDEITGAQRRAADARKRLESAMRASQNPSSQTWARTRNAIGGIAGMDTEKPLAQSMRDIYGQISKKFRQIGQEAQTGGGSNTEKAARNVAAQDAAKRADSIAEQGEIAAKHIEELSALDNPSLTSTYLGQRVAMLIPDGETVPIAATELGPLPSEKKLGEYGMFKLKVNGYGTLVVNAEAAREMVEGGPRSSQIAAKLKVDPGTAKGFEKVLNELAKQPDISMSKIMGSLQGYGKGGSIDLREATHVVVGERKGQQSNAIFSNMPGETEWILRTRHGAEKVDIHEATPENLQRIFQDRVNAIQDPKLRDYWQKQIDDIGSVARAERERRERAPEASAAHVEAVRTIDEIVSETSDDIARLRVEAEIDPDASFDWEQHASTIERLREQSEQARSLIADVEVADPEQHAFLKAKLDQRDAEIAALKSEVEEERRRASVAIERALTKGRKRRDPIGVVKAEEAEGLSEAREPAQPGIVGPKQQALIEEAAQSGNVPKPVRDRLAKRSGAAARSPETAGEREKLLSDVNLERKSNESVAEWVERINKIKDLAETGHNQSRRMAEKSIDDKSIRQANAAMADWEAVMLAANKRIADINRDFPPGTVFMHSGPPLAPQMQKFFDEQIVPFVKSNLRALRTALTDRADARAMLNDVGERNRIKLSEWVDRQATRSKVPGLYRKVAQLLNLPAPQQFVRELDKQRRADLDRVTALKSQFEFKLAQHSPEDRVAFWKSAETGDKSRTAPIFHGMLDAYHKFTQAVAHEMIAGGQLDPDAAASLRGKYVGHFPGKGTEKLKAELRRSGGTTEMEQRLAKKLQEAFAHAQRKAAPGTHGQGGIGTIADEIRAFVDRHTRSRTPLTPEEMEYLGYMKGALPIIKTIEEEGSIWANFKFLRNVKEHPESRPYWKTLDEAMADGLVNEKGQVIEPNWSLAKHTGFGAFQNHVIHDSLYSQLSGSIPEARNGWFHVAQQISGMAREGVTSQSGLGYQVVTALVDNPLHAMAAGASLARLPQRQAEFWRDYAELMRSGKQSETMRALIQSGHFKTGHEVLNVDPTAGTTVSDFRDLNSKRSQYLKDFAQRTAEVWAANVANRPRGGGILSWTIGDGVKTWRQIIKGFDPAKATGVPFGGGSGVLKGAKFSGEGLTDLQSIIDASYKYAVLKDLREHGGNGLTNQALRAILGKGGKARGMTHEESMRVLDDWYSFEKQPTIIKAVSSIPGLFAFARVPLIKTWNLFGRGYAIDNPIGAAANVSAMWMAAQAGAAMIQSVYGYTEEQIEKMKLVAADGDAERADQLVPTFVSEDHNGDPTVVFTDWGRTGDIQFAQKFLNPSEFARPVPGEKPMQRFVRGMAASDPMTSLAYKAMTGKEAMSGFDDAQFGTATIPEKLGRAATLMGVPMAGDVSSLLRSSGKDKADLEAGKEPYSSTTERLVRAGTKLPAREISIPGSKRGDEQAKKASRRAANRENAEDPDLEWQTHTDLVKPKLPKNPSEDEVREYVKKLGKYREARRKLDQSK